MKHMFTQSDENNTQDYTVSRQYDHNLYFYCRKTLQSPCTQCGILQNNFIWKGGGGTDLLGI